MWPVSEWFLTGHQRSVDTAIEIADTTSSVARQDHIAADPTSPGRFNEEITRVMPDLIKQATDTGETIEFRLGGWPLGMYLILSLWSFYSIFHPSNWMILFRWSWLSALWCLAFLVVILRHVEWSPFYVGPTIKLTNSAISGRGGWGHRPWQLNLDQVERVDCGRNGVFIYKKGRHSWDVPYCQPGPFNTSCRTIVRCVEARLNKCQ